MQIGKVMQDQARTMQETGSQQTAGEGFGELLQLLLGVPTSSEPQGQQEQAESLFANFANTESGLCQDSLNSQEDNDLVKEEQVLAQLGIANVNFMLLNPDLTVSEEEGLSVQLTEDIAPRSQANIETSVIEEESTLLRVKTEMGSRNNVVGEEQQLAAKISTPQELKQAEMAKPSQPILQSQSATTANQRLQPDNLTAVQVIEPSELPGDLAQQRLGVANNADFQSQSSTITSQRLQPDNLTAVQVIEPSKLQGDLTQQTLSVANNTTLTVQTEDDKPHSMTAVEESPLIAGKESNNSGGYNKEATVPQQPGNLDSTDKVARVTVLKELSLENQVKGQSQPTVSSKQEPQVNNQLTQEKITKVVDQQAKTETVAEVQPQNKLSLGSNQVTEGSGQKDSNQPDVDFQIRQEPITSATTKPAEQNNSPVPIREIPVTQLPTRLSEMVRAMMIQQNPGQTTLKMKLQPEQLGEVTVKLTWSKGELSAQFIAATGAAKEALESSFPQLKELLAQQNIRLSEAAVFMGQQSGQWERNQSDSRQTWQFKGQAKAKGGYPKEVAPVDMITTGGKIPVNNQGVNIVV